MTIKPKAPTYPFTLPKLRYDYGALEPHMDATTLEIHHSKHHAAYIAKLNESLSDYPELHQFTIEELLSRIDEVPESIRLVVRNQGGGHANHQFFWKILSPPKQSSPKGELLVAIERAFGSFNEFKNHFNKSAINLFGSGWVFLVVDPALGGHLKIFSGSNHESVLYHQTPGLLICDVWEHAYYLKHQNRRAEYMECYWKLVDWDVVESRLLNIREKPQAES